MENSSARPPSASSSSTLPSSQEIQAWMVSYLADLLDMEPEEVETDVPFDSYGLDSSSAVGMTGELEEWLGAEVDPTFIYDYPTVKALAQHLGETQLKAS
ncbi:MAG: acyl carrier protein [Phormidesmis sp. RL_2_1]|nr:acyl carrier protein [Phormidesmis sp. RL_2_1]